MYGNYGSALHIHPRQSTHSHHQLAVCILCAKDSKKHEDVTGLSRRIRDMNTKSIRFNFPTKFFSAVCEMKLSPGLHAQRNVVVGTERFLVCSDRRPSIMIRASVVKRNIRHTEPGGHLGQSVSWPCLHLRVSLSFVGVTTCCLSDRVSGRMRSPQE